LLRDLFKRLLPGSEPVRKPAPVFSPGAANAGRAAQPPSPDDTDPASTEGHARHSHGLEQFLSQLTTQESLCVLDVGGATQANVGFLTNMGHKVYSERFLDLLDTLDKDAPDDPAPAPSLAFVDTFLRQNLDFPAGWFDGVLLWDSLEFLPPPLLKATVERLYYVTKPGAYLLAYFHSDEKAAELATYSYRIRDSSTLMLARKRMRQPCQPFNNRSVEKLFQRFQSVKFFLARDHLREVIVRR
jgi:hypothetical protein